MTTEEREKEVKALGQFRLSLNPILEPFNLYGQGIYIPEMANQITKQALILHKRLNGEDIPFGN